MFFLWVRVLVLFDCQTFICICVLVCCYKSSLGGLIFPACVVVVIYGFL